MVSHAAPGSESDNSISSNSVSEDIVSDNSVSDNTVSEDTASLNVYHRTQPEIAKFIKDNPANRLKAPDVYKLQPSLTSPYSAGTLTDKAETAALNALNQVRYAAGLDADVVGDTTYTSKAQAASLVNAINKSLKRPPVKPAGMSDELYELARSGANQSLLAGDCDTLARAVQEVWIPDKKNESTLGLRRWALNPEMKKTGFGQVEKYEAMYVFDRGRKTGTRTVAWPAENMPIDWMYDGMPWSVSFGWKLDESKIEVKLESEKDGKVWNFSKDKSDGKFYVNNANYGQQGCVIFKPDKLKATAGERYKVRISGASEMTLEYYVDFFMPEVEVKLSQTHVVIPPDAEYLLKASVTPSSAPQSVIWSVAEGDAVSVDDKGNVKALKLGKATVRATSAASSGIWAECEVVVEEESLTPPYIYSASGRYLEVGDQIQISAALPEEGLKILYAVDEEAYKEYLSPIIVEESMCGRDIRVRAFVSANEASKHKSSEISEAVFSIAEEDVRGDITDEDWETISENGVPQGIWVRGIEPSYDYTGKKIKIADLRVYYNNIRLKKADYSVKYLNNKDAGKASVKISLKGNFKNDEMHPLIYYFRIKPIDISGDDFEADDMCLSVKKDASGRLKWLSVRPKVMYKGKTFSLKNADVLCYEEGDAKLQHSMSMVMNPGEYTIVIRGKKNYSGERVIKLRVDTRISLNEMTASGYTRKVKLDPSKEGQEPDLSRLKLKSGKLSLTAADLNRFEVSLSDNKCTGRAYVLISARPDDSEYAGFIKLPFTITGYSIKKSFISFPKEQYYTGSEVVFSDAELNVRSKISGSRLEEGKDMLVAYEKNLNAGTARLIITGMGAYSGTIKKNFKIKRCNIKEFSGRISISIPGELRFSKNGNVMKKRMIVMNDAVSGKVLREGSDIKLKYYNNKSVNSSKDPYVKFTGKGNYCGSVKRYFRIQAPDIRETSMLAGNIVYKDKTGNYKSPYVLFDVDGGKLKSGTDYNKAAYTYAYYTTVRVKDSAVKENRMAGEKIQPGDILPEGCVVRLSVNGKGNYSGKDEKGQPLTKDCEYMLVKDDISKITFITDPFEYTGRQIKPIPVGYDSKEQGIHAYYYNGSRMDALGQYHVLYYTSNLKKGTAKITVTGSGSFGGTRTIKFKITKRYGRKAQGE